MSKSMLFLISLLVHGCANKPAISRKHIAEKIAVVYRLPYLHAQDSIAVVVDSSIIYYNDSAYLYLTPLRVSSTMGDSVIYDSLKFSYFGFKKNESKGFCSTMLPLSKNKMGNVDSLLANRPNSKFVLDLIKKSKLKGYKIIDENLKVETYIFQDKELDTINVFYRSGKWKNYSFPTFSDSSGNFKFYKAEIFLKEFSENMKIREENRKVKLEFYPMEVNEADSLEIQSLKGIM